MCCYPSLNNQTSALSAVIRNIYYNLSSDVVRWQVIQIAALYYSGRNRDRIIILQSLVLNIVSVLFFMLNIKYKNYVLWGICTRIIV